MKNLAIILVATLATGAAWAQTEARKVQFEAETGPVTVNSVQPPIANAGDYRITVADLDDNGDGYIQRREVPAGHALESEFRLVDSNRDGRISAEELANWK
jgi:hypothetical protein